MPAYGVALRFIDVVDWQGSSNSRMQSNMEGGVGERREGLYLVSPERDACVHPPAIDIDLRKQILFSQLDIHFGASPKSLCRSQTKQSSAAANAKPT